MPIHEDFADTLETVAQFAVGKIGETVTLVDLETDTGSVVEQINLFFAQVIREVQTEFRWPELVKSVALESPIAENEDTYQYTLPSDYLRPASNRDQSYVIENGYLFTATSENFPLRYIRYSNDPSEWSALLVKCIYYRLALEICLPVTENLNRYNGLLQEYETLVFPRARQVASFDHENPKTRIAHGRYARTRGRNLGEATATPFNRVIGEIAPGHHHDEDYAALDAFTAHVAEFNAHDHDADYSAIDHDHDADYSAIDHDHDAEYAALVHHHIPNVAYAIKTDTMEFNPDTFPEWTNIPDLAVTITPNRADSKLRVKAVVYGCSNHVSTPVFLRVTRDAVALELTDTPGDRTEVHALIPAESDINDELGCGVIELLIDATATDATTLRIQLANNNAAYNGYINRASGDTDSAAYVRAISTLSVEEVYTT